MFSAQEYLSPSQYQSFIYNKCRRSKPNSGGASQERKRQFSSYETTTNAMRVAKLVRLGRGKKVSVPIDVNYLGRIEGRGGGALLRNTF
jgi:hypothetical protein